MLWMREISYLQMRMIRPNIAWYIRQSSCSGFFNAGINTRTRENFVNLDFMC